MRLTLRSVAHPVIEHYEKIIAVAVLTGLLVSVVWLGVRTAAEKNRQLKLTDEIERLVPLKPKVEPVMRGIFGNAMKEMDNPKQLESGTNTMLLPEPRVSCASCRKPIPYLARQCPFPTCNVIQPDSTTEAQQKKDRDGDGLPDEWELKHGLNPTFAGDAKADPDNDGYTSLEEYMAGQNGTNATNPNDGNDVPPAWMFEKLVVEKTVATAFQLRFMDSTIQPDGSTNFALNYVETRQTYWAKLGQQVRDYTLEKYEEKSVLRTNTTVGATMVDVSELTLRSANGAVVVLVKRVPREEWERSADLRYLPEARIIKALGGAEIEVRGRKYRLKEIDAQRNMVLLIDISLDREVEIGRPGGTK